MHAIKMFATSVVALLLSATPAHADSFTLEPTDFDGVFWTQNITQMEFSGKQCPCQKVAYPASGWPWDTTVGADEIWKLVQAGTIKTGDTLIGFSLGVQVISQFMSQHQLPTGVKVLLAGDTFWRNGQYLSMNVGIPWDTSTQVTMVANEYDGWSDYPDKTSAPGYWAAVQNAIMGTQQVHNYIHAQLDSPANVVEVRGNITAILIPNQKLPIGDETLRAQIDGAYTRAAPTAAQLAAAGVEQTGPTIPGQTSEPVAH
jgi:hypothetical protein